MITVSFTISDTDYDRLYAIKEAQGKQDWTGNQFAKDLFERELHRLCPTAPQVDEQG